MEVDLTLRTPAGEHDLRVTAAPHATVGDLVERLQVMGLGVGPDLWLRGERLEVQRTLTDAGVLGGAIIDAAAPPVAPGGAATLAVVGGPAAGRRIRLPAGRSELGRAPACAAWLGEDTAVSRLHAVVEVGADGVRVTDAGSANGTRIDGEPIDRRTVLSADGLLRVGDCFLTVDARGEAPGTVRRAEHALVLTRPPRLRPPAGPVQIDWPPPPSATPRHRLQIAAALVPAAVGIAFAYFLRSPHFLLFALLSPVLLLTTGVSDRWQWRRERRRSSREFRAAVAAAQAAAADALAAETKHRRQSSPDPVTLADIAALPSTRAWERRLGDDDFLAVRLGLGSVDSAAQTHEGTASRPAGACRDVPITVQLGTGALGLVGPPERVRAAARWLVAQIAALHPPGEVEIVLLLDPVSEPAWRWAQWLPHVRGRVAADEEGRQALIRDLTSLVAERVSVQRRASVSYPACIAIVDVAPSVDLRGLPRALADGSAVGISGIVLALAVAALPAGCRSIGAFSGAAGARIELRRDRTEPQAAVPDEVTTSWAEGVARSLAPLVEGDGSAGAGLPAQCRLTDVLGLDNADADAIEARWRVAGDGAATPLGIGPDGPLVVDLVADGPHALIAGTTGSGKSELLQSLVVGLAAHHPPDQLSFLLVDYKGGAAFADAARLPHTSGVVTDLDARLTQRALRSLHAELLRRERLFAAADVPDLLAYRRIRPAPAVPRLIIVVDEFAALAEELPDFVTGLVGVAQRGRSLGVHLVLATQRPGSVVSPEIRANASLRIALRVTGAAESSEIIDSGAAAGIDRRTPGRALLRVGSTLTPFQTGHVGAPVRPRRERVQVSVLAPWRQGPPGGPPGGATDLITLVDAIARAAAAAGCAGHPSPWLEALPERLPVAALAAPGPCALPVGLVDLPDEQAREIVTVDLRDGRSTLVSGRSRSGRSSALITVGCVAAEQLTSADVYLYIVDPTGGLAALRNLEHTATYLGPNDVPRAARLITRLEADMERRRQHLTDGGDLPPHALLLVDGWEVLTAALEEVDGGRSVDTLLGLARSGPGAGVTVVASGDRATLAPRVSSAFGQRIVLAVTDRADLALAGVPGRHALPAALPGRGIRAADGAELQLAVAQPPLTPAGQHGGQPARQRAGQQAGQPTGEATVRPHAGAARIRIVSLPTRVAQADVAPAAGALTLGLGGDDATPVRWEHGDHAQLLVAGPPRSGRTTLLRLLLTQAVANDLKAVAVCTTRSPLHAAAMRAGAETLLPDELLPGHLGDSRDPLLLLVDDVELLADRPLAEQLLHLVRADDARVVLVAAGRSEEVATSYRGLLAELRRLRRGLLLRPGPADGDILGVRLPRTREAMPPGRGVLVGDPQWGAHVASGEPVTVQVATP